MRILFLGSRAGSAGQRAGALGRLGHQVAVVDPADAIRGSRAIGAWAWRTGGLFVEPLVRRYVLRHLPWQRLDMVLVDGGDLVGSRLIGRLQKHCGRIVNYNLDDPFGTRDGRRWRLYLRAVPSYDLVVVVRDVNVGEALAHGARNVLRVFRSADEVWHAPRPLGAAQRARWASDVVFVGTWMPGRGRFIADLIDAGLPVSIFGNRWHKAPEHRFIRRAWRGSEIVGVDYVSAIQSAQVCLGLVSKGNRDLHTQRSAEIPFAQGVFCGERTSEHEALYSDGREAVLWADAEECVARCRSLLGRADLQESIARAGRARCLANGLTNETVLQQVLDAVRSGGRRGV
jgi:spore maturation protein CgeB